MKRNLKKTLFLIASAILVLVIFSACNMGLPWDIEVWGEWESSGVKLEITNDTYISDSLNYDWDYTCEIVDYDNSSYNIESENPASGDYGYLVMKFTKHTGDSTQIGTYTVVRWRALATNDGVTTMEYSEAYPAGWKTAEEAVAQANVDNNFAYYSSLTKSED